MKILNNKLVRIAIIEANPGSRILWIFADFILLNIVFFMMNYFRRDTLRIRPDYVTLLLLLYSIWFIVSLISKKYYKVKLSLKSMMLVQAKSAVFMVYCTSFLVVFFGLSSFSRIHVFGTFLLFYILETLMFLLVNIGKKREEEFKHNQERIKDAAGLHRTRISILLLFSDFILLTMVFFAVYFSRRGTFNLSTEYEKILLLIFGLWLIAAIITQKFSIQNFQNLYFALAANFKAIIFIIFSMSSIIFAFRLFHFSRMTLFGSLLIYFLLESLLTSLYFVLKFGKDLNDDIKSIDEIHDFFSQKDLPKEEEQQLDLGLQKLSFMKILCERYFNTFPELQKFVDQTIDVSKLDDSQIAFANSADFFDVRILKDRSIKLFVNLHKINDVRWINRYFLEVHKRLKSGGYIIGRVDTISIHKQRFFQKYPKYFREVMYLIHFIIYRVFPKLPELRKIYFALTKGKKRMISRAEVLGRLCFCGFRILWEKELGGSLFYIAQKAKTPSVDQNPSYGPVISLRRTGLYGQMIDVYKFRTMFPYSEYLQEYIYERQKLGEGGKIEKDFRVTDWGKFMRRYWLDELPMLYNWMRGEIKLFGVRPLSRHYLSLYDKYLQNLRREVKPGLIPPYYADLPKRIEDINESEKQYILAYQKHPVRTQIVYFIKVINNILFKGARSG